MSSEVMDIIGRLLVLANSEGGQSLLLKFFADHGISKDVVTRAIESLPSVKDTKEVSNG